jgi:hypothetical protein
MMILPTHIPLAETGKTHCTRGYRRLIDVVDVMGASASRED